MSGPMQVLYDRTYLDRSFEWLQDEELCRTIRATKPTRESQARWYASLPNRDDYLIWGIELDGEPVGVFGLKDVGQEDGGEYFMYLGHRRWWGRGIAAWAFGEIVREAQAAGVRWLYGRIAKENLRSVYVHLRLGYEVDRDEGETWWIRFPLEERDRHSGLRAVGFDPTFREIAKAWLARSDLTATATNLASVEGGTEWWVGARPAERDDGEPAVWGIRRDATPVGVFGLFRDAGDGLEVFYCLGEMELYGPDIAELITRTVLDATPHLGPKVSLRVRPGDPVARDLSREQGLVVVSL